MPTDGTPAPITRRTLRGNLGLAFVAGVTVLSIVVAWAGADTIALVAGAGIAVLLLAPLLAHMHLGRLSIHGPLSHTTVAGMNLPLELRLVNHGLWTARDLLVSVDDGRHASSPATGHCSALPPGRSAAVRTVPRFPERGRKESVRVSIETSFPFGLFHCSANVELPIDLLVLPRLGRLGPLEERMRQAGVADELPRGPAAHGDFYALRDWREGEPLRGVAWKLSARCGRLLSREFQREDLPTVDVILSTRVVATEGRGRRIPSFERAVSLAATTVEHFLRGGQRIRLTLAGTEVRRLPLARGRGELLPQLAALAEVVHEDGEPYDALGVANGTAPGSVAVVVLAGGGSEPGTRAAPSLGKRTILVLDVDRESGIEVFEGMRSTASRLRAVDALAEDARR